MLLEIVQYGDPVLRQKCRRVGSIDDDDCIQALVHNMLETMRAADGIGLAAPQVGVPIQLAVIDVSHDPECVSLLKVNGKEAKLTDIMPLVFINPELELISPKAAETEGCLSIQDLREPVTRPTIVKAKLPQLDGSVLELETDGLLARAIQHETDHLNGILFIDRLSSAKKLTVKRKLKRLRPAH